MSAVIHRVCSSRFFRRPSCFKAKSTIPARVLFQIHDPSLIKQGLPFSSHHCSNCRCYPISIPQQATRHRMSEEYSFFRVTCAQKSSTSVAIPSIPFQPITQINSMIRHLLSQRDIKAASWRDTSCCIACLVASIQSLVLPLGLRNHEANPVQPQPRIRSGSGTGSKNSPRGWLHFHSALNPAAVMSLKWLGSPG